MSLYPNYETNKKYMENMMGVKTPLKETAAGANRRKVKIYGSFIKKMFTLKKCSREFLDRFNEVTEPYNGNTFEGKSSKELLKIYDEIEKQILNEFTTPITNDIGAMVFYGMLTDDLKKHNVKDAEGIISSLLSKQGNVESAEQTESLLQIVEKIKADERLKQKFIDGKIGLDSKEPIIEEIKEAALEAYRNGGFPIEVKMYTSEAGSQSNSILRKQIYPEPNGDGNWSLYYPDWYAQYGAGVFSSIQMFGKNDPKIMFSIGWGDTGEVNDNGYHLFRLSDYCYYRPSFYGESSVGAKTLEAEAERLNNEE